MRGFSSASLRRLGGGDRRALRFLRATYGEHRGIVTLSLVLHILATLFETSTVGILVVALRTLSGVDTETLGAVPGIGPTLAELGLRWGQQGFFLFLVGLAVVAQLAVSALEFGGRAATARLQADVEGGLRSRVFRQLMAMSYAQVRLRKVGELAAYNEQVSYVGQVIHLINLIASQLIMMVAYVGLLFWLSWKMTLAALVAVLVLSLAFRRIIRHIRGLGKAFAKASVSLTSRTVEFLHGLRLLRTFAREEYAIAKVEDAVRRSVAFRRRGLIWNASIGPLADSVTVVGIAAFLIAGYLFFDQGGPTALASLIPFLFVLYRLLPRIKLVNDRLGFVNNYWEFVHRVSEILRVDDKQYDAVGGEPFAGLEQAIVFRDVSLRYADTEEPALRQVSFQLARGEVLGVVGESGAGKSSIADLLLGLYLPTSGSIEVDGRDLCELDWRQWRDHLGVVTQDSFILHATVRDNVAFGRLDASDEAIRRACVAADAEGFIRGLAQGYDTVVGDQGYRLSAGQRQRLALARAILRDPEVLILDEATSHLDSRSERAIQEALKRLRGNRTLLIIAHRLSTLTWADRIVVLEGGSKVEEGRHDELLSLGGRYAHLWQIQSDSAGQPRTDVGP